LRYFGATLRTSPLPACSSSPIVALPFAEPEEFVITVEPARISDVNAIHDLVTFWADRGDMLHRPLGEVFEAIRDFKVARVDGEVVGCGSLHIMGADLAEVRSLAVREDAQGRHVGAAIVSACVDDARQLGLARVFALTYRPGFFERQGFRLANVMEFPQKVWNECVRCPFFTNCKEVAMVMELGEGADLSLPLADPSPGLPEPAAARQAPGERSNLVPRVEWRHWTGSTSRELGLRAGSLGRFASNPFFRTPSLLIAPP